jgi:hypothetical protein
LYTKLGPAQCYSRTAQADHAWRAFGQSVGRAHARHLTPALSATHHLRSRARHLALGLHAQRMQPLPHAPYPLAVGPKEKLVPSSSRNCRQALAHFALPLTVRLYSKRRALATEHRPSAPASPPLGAQVLDLTPTAVGSSSARAGRAPSRGPATPTVPWGHLHRYDLRPSSLSLPDLRADTLYLLSG